MNENFKIERDLELILKFSLITQGNELNAAIMANSQPQQTAQQQPQIQPQVKSKYFLRKISFSNQIVLQF